jgi:hypothetical protein
MSAALAAALRSSVPDHLEAPMPGTTSAMIFYLITGFDTGPATVVALILVAPIAALTVVLTWHGLRGTNPGPAGALFLKLVELVLFRRRPR